MAIGCVIYDYYFLLWQYCSIEEYSAGTVLFCNKGCMCILGLVLIREIAIEGGRRGCSDEMESAEGFAS